MKKYLLWWLAIVVLWILVYLGLPYIRFWLLYWFNHEQVERYKSMTKDFTLSEKYNLYTQWYRTIKFNDFMIDLYLFDKEAVKKDSTKFNELNELILDKYNLNYKYNRYIKKWDKAIFKDMEQAVRAELNF